MFTALTTAAIYWASLHALRKARQYVPNGKVANVIDTTLRAMGGGGSGPIKPS